MIHLVERTTRQPIRLIGAASASRHALLKQKPYNYDLLVDYLDANWPEKLRAATGSRLAIFRPEETGSLDLSSMRAKTLYSASWECLGADIEFFGNYSRPPHPRSCPTQSCLAK